MTTEEPAVITALRDELAAIRGRLEICEAALKELVECYETITQRIPLQ